MKYTIVVVDSGVSISNNEELYGCFLSPTKKDPLCDFSDDLNHGTGIYGIIKSHNPSANIFNLKICSKSHSQINIQDLINALEYIEANISCKIINVCLALSVSANISELKKLEMICKKLDSKGSIIIASFDNYGSLSYPASFDSVIGVTSGDLCHKTSDYEFVESDSVNIAAFGRDQKILSSKGGFMLSKGTSLACAHITGISSLICKQTTSRQSLLRLLKKDAISNHYYKDSSCLSKNGINFCRHIKNALTFPLNKEIYPLLRFENSLSFKITEVCDIKHSCNIGSNTNHLLHLSNGPGHVVKNFLSVDFNVFDTVILGHTNAIETISTTLNSQIDSFLQKCISYNKKVYSFDLRDKTFTDYPFYFTPSLRTKDITYAPFGKLFRNPIPVVGIFGTSSQQGKFSIQLELRKIFSNFGYRVGQIGTEPSSFLFGMDSCFHYGYNAYPSVVRFDCVSFINKEICEIVSKGAEIIFVGGQSRMLPADNGNVNNFTFPQIEFLFATQPDLVILSVNSWDDFSYITKTISFIESSVNGKVIALMLSPFEKKLDPFANLIETTVLSSKKIKSYIDSFEKHFGLPTYCVLHPEDYQKIANQIIEILTIE